MSKKKPSKTPPKPKSPARQKSGGCPARTYTPPEGHPEIPGGNHEKVGVLLLNLGTPDGHDYWSMRRYLKEFLWDERVIDVSRPLWWFLLNVIILTKRPFTSGAAYREIWNHELNESPLKTLSRTQAQHIEKALKKSCGEAVVVDWVQRYGNPSIESGIQNLKAQGCQKILFFALYPQYAAPTSATAFDKCFEVLQGMRWQPAIRTNPPYHDEDAYITALADSVTAHYKTLKWKPDLLIASFHGVPQRYLELGDPYHCQCQKTARLLREKLGMGEDAFKITFQSRFGNEEWLKPYTDETIKGLPDKGVKNLAVICPGFSADCLETLEEIEGENAEYFHEAGGKNFTYIPALNDAPSHMTLLTALIQRELQGWV